MIIGDGDIASALTDRDDRIYFASGVSSGAETRQSEFQREIDLLMEQDKSKHLIYFSSLCIFYSDTPYAKHKRNMEGIIKNNFNNYTIVRLGNITWGKNPKHLFNFFRSKIKNNEPFEIWDTYRYPIDKEEFLHWIDLIPRFSCEMNITGKPMKVSEIVEQIKNEQK